MKRLLGYISFLVFLIGLVFAPTIYSQEPEENEFRVAFSDYTLSIEEYREAHEEYVLARSQYLRFNTLQAKTNAREATLKMLQARDKVVIAYLAAFKAKLEETEGISDDKRGELNFRIDEEITWFSEHKELLPSAGTPEDLVDDSDEAKKRFLSREALFYEALSTISSGKVRDFRARLSDVFTAIGDKVNEIKEEDREGYSFSTRKLQLVDRWIFETENRISRSDGKHDEALDLMSMISPLFGDNKGRYDKVLLKLGESRQYLKEASSFLLEIVREIKTAE